MQVCAREVYVPSVLQSGGIRFILSDCHHIYACTNPPWHHVSFSLGLHHAAEAGQCFKWERAAGRRAHLDPTAVTTSDLRTLVSTVGVLLPGAAPLRP